MDLSSAWGIARMILGENSNLTRMVKLIVVTNPKRLANLFNNLFRTKIQLLREKTNQPPAIPPCQRLRNWLAQRDEPPQTIDKKMFRRIITKIKSKRVHGVDWIDSYSLKVPSPLIEDPLDQSIYLW